MRHGKERLWALVMAFVLLLSNFALAEGEMATSPDLSDEPVLTCEHVFERKTDPAAEREAFEPINAWMHKYSAFIPVWEECGKCGLRRNQSEELSRTENVPHIFINGVCEQCGQANLCTHEKKTAVYDPDGPVEYTPLDEQSHTLRYDATLRYRCMTCREEWYDAATPVQHVEETAAHNFSDSGQCICGYTAQVQQEPCKHENRGEFSMMDGSVAFVDATGHSITGRRLWFEACEDCGLILSETPVRIEENVTEKGPHLFYLGLYCEVCGYIPDPEDVPAYECDHMETYERTLTGDNGYTADDANHTPASYVIVQTVCANDICGEVIEEKGTYTPLENALPEPHAFEDGVCAVCGHACSHPNISNEESYSVYEYVPLDAWAHTTNVYNVTSGVCENCGLILSEQKTLVDTFQTAHFFWDGVCEDCGTESICPHDMKRAVYGPGLEEECVMIDERTHSVTYDAEPFYRCLRCGVEWQDESLGTVHMTEISAHDFDAQGVCYGCGFVNACAHEHLSEFYFLNYSYDIECSSFTADTHTVSAYRDVYQCCEDCGMIWYDEPIRVEPYTATEAHQIDVAITGPQCTVCGYIPTSGTTIPEEGLPVYECSHYDARRIFWRVFAGEDGCMPVEGTNTHIAAHTSVTQQVCGICSGVLSEEIAYTPVEGAAAQAHTYDENGACTACGYKHEHVFENGVCAGCGAECGHESEPRRHFVREEMKYSYYTAWADHMDCYLTWQLTCADCGADLGTVEELDFEDLSAHVFVDGVCQNCGCENVCPHDMKTLRYDEPDAGDIAYEAVDGKTHTLSYEVRPYYYCARCATAWQDETLPVQRVVEEREHVWNTYTTFEEDGAVCVECGYDRGYTPSTCAHEHMTAYYEWSDRTVERDVNGHKITGCRVSYPQCADCGEIWWDQPAGVDTEPYTETSAHVYDDYHGALYCPECGFTLNLATAGPEEGLPACVNAETYSREVWTDAVRAENAQTHISGWLCARQEVCAACCVVLSEETEFVPDASAQSEPHTYANGICTACGAEEPDEPTQPGETDEPTQPGETDEPTQPGETDEPAQPDETDEPTQPGKTDEPEQPTPTPSAPVATPTPIPRPTATTPATVRPTMPVVSDIPIEQTPAPTPAPVYTQVPVTETVHGVKAEDNVPMAEALATIADNIAAAGEAEGVAVGIEIVNAEKIVTAAEKAALDALPVREQILTFLSVIGFEEQVNRTLETAGEILSEPALALKAQIQERIAAMSEQEYAAFEAVLLESFPQEAIEIDGEEYIFFIIELEVRVGDSVRIERYGFRREGDEWIFAQLEIAG